MSWSSVIPALQGNSGRRRALWGPGSHNRLQTLPMGSLEELRVWKCKLLTPDSWDAYERNDFNQPKLLHLPIHRKALNFLTWDIWFPLSIRSWWSDYLPFSAQLLYNLALLPFPLRAVLSSYLRCCLPGLSPKNFCQRKHSSWLLGCD